METSLDLNNEKAVQHYLQNHKQIFSCKLNANKYNIDLALFQKTHLIGWGEIKARNIRSDKYDSYIIDVGKIARAKQYTELTGTHFTLFVLFTDVLMSWTLFPETDMTGYNCIYQSSSQRGTSEPQEQPCFHIPINEFYPLIETTKITF